MGMAASVCGGIAAIVVVVMLMFAGILAALVTLVVLTLVLLPLVIHGRDGHTGYEKILAATLFRRADRAGKTKYVSGVTGQTPDGCTRLPGLLAATELVSGTDVYGEEFGVLITPAIEHYAIVFQTEATGAEMVNQSVTDNEVAHHGGWLAQLSQEADVVAAAVTVETAPDPGTRLVRMMNRHRQDDAPEFSGATMDEIAQKYPVASSSITTRVAVTFNGKPRAGEQARARVDMLDYLARRLPGFRAGLTTTGAGTAVRAMSAADLTDAVRVAYDPSVAQLVEEERAAGGTGLTWSEAGPAYAREFGEHYSHNGAHSISWHMKEPPSGVFYDQVLRDLLKPHGDIDRKTGHPGVPPGTRRTRPADRGERHPRRHHPSDVAGTAPASGFDHARRRPQVRERAGHRGRGGAVRDDRHRHRDRRGHVGAGGIHGAAARRLPTHPVAPGPLQPSRHVRRRPAPGVGAARAPGGARLDARRPVTAANTAAWAVFAAAGDRNGRDRPHHHHPLLRCFLPPLMLERTI